MVPRSSSSKFSTMTMQAKQAVSGSACQLRSNQTPSQRSLSPANNGTRRTTFADDLTIEHHQEDVKMRLDDKVHDSSSKKRSGNDGNLFSWATLEAGVWRISNLPPPTPLERNPTFQSKTRRNLFLSFRSLSTPWLRQSRIM